jgi:hypothetical protein
MSINNNQTSPRFRLITRIIGIAVMIAPAIILMVAPAPIGFSGDYVGPRGMAFLFFLLSIPIGFFIINFGKNPSRTKKVTLILVGVWAVLSVLSLLGDLINRLMHGTL